MAERGARVRAAIGNVSFFNDALEKRIDAGLYRPMNHFGASVRLRSKRSIRRSVRKKDSELTPREWARKKRRQREASLEHGEIVLNPFKPAPANSPPRTPTGILPTTIYYAFNEGEGRNSVFCGPIAFDKNPGEATGALEKGGMSRGKHVDARPFMKPAFDAALKNDIGRFQNFIK